MSCDSRGCQHGCREVLGKPKCFCFKGFRQNGSSCVGKFFEMILGKVIFTNQLFNLINCFKQYAKTVNRPVKVLFPNFNYVTILLEEGE